MFKKTPIVFFCAGMLLALFLNLGSRSFAEEGQVKLVGDMAQLPALAPYLANEILLVDDPNITNTLVVGSDLSASGATPPFPLIFPDDAKIAGAIVSVRTNNGITHANYEIYLTSALSPKAFVEFYTKNLGSNFTLANSSGQRRNTQQLYNPALGHATYCYTGVDGSKTLLMIRTGVQGELTQANISIAPFSQTQPRRHSLC